MISWLSRKHKLVALNTTEEEYIKASVKNYETVWLQKMLTGIFDLELEPTLIHCDNQSCANILEKKLFSCQFK
jgi:hypothetical protein